MKINFFYFPFLLLFPFLLPCHELPSVSERFIKADQEISLIIEYDFFSTDRFWSREGGQISAYNTVTHQGVSLYGEYGLTSCDTLGIYSFYSQNQEKMNRSPRGFGDCELVWKHFINCLNAYQFSFQIIGIIPTGDANPSIRHGEWGLEGDLHLQKDYSICQKYGWLEALIGYRYYQGRPSDQLRGYILGGYYLCPKLKLLCEVALDYSLNLRHANFQGPILTHPESYRLIQTKFEVVWDLFSHCSLYLGSSQNIWGRNIGAEVTFIGGIWIDSVGN